MKFSDRLNDRLRARRQASSGRREWIAEAVHRAVCEFTGTDGFGNCMMYAWAGVSLCSRVFQRTYLLQAGSLRIQADPSNPHSWFTIDASEDGFHIGEFHAWCG